MVKQRARHRLRMGFKEDFDIIEVEIIRIEPVVTDRAEAEQIEWIYAEVPVKQFRVRSSVVLSVVGIIAAGVGLI